MNSQSTKAHPKGVVFNRLETGCVGSTAATT
jgi:hypothetical protein